MLCDNIRAFRKAKGLSQEELAARLNVVRQTVSKWENGLSVPDSDMLTKLASVLDVSVVDLLEDPLDIGKDHAEKDALLSISARISDLDEKLDILSAKRKKVWRIFFVSVGLAAMVALVCSITGHLFCLNRIGINKNAGVIGSFDGPTNIFVLSAQGFGVMLLVELTVIVLAVIGFYKIGKDRGDK